MFEFSNEKFSGPLGLLLSLIEKEELDITEISLAKIADDYICQIRQSDKIEAEETADFLLIAAKLLFIKSKALLPYLYAAEEDEDLDDLTSQLKMYQEFIAASVNIKNKLLEGKRLYLPNLSKGFRFQGSGPSFSPPLKLNIDILHNKFLDLLEILRNELERRDKEKLVVESLEAKISIDDKISSIKDLLLKKFKLNFSHLLSRAKSRTEVIVSFLAVLELAKQKELYFEQDELFSDITINLGSNDDLISEEESILELETSL